MLLEGYVFFILCGTLAILVANYKKKHDEVRARQRNFDDDLDL